VNLTWDTKAIEKQLKFKLPKSYIDFITQVGPTTFENVDELSGYSVSIFPPDKLDDKHFRAGKLETDDEESKVIDGVMFALAINGDCFCFDIQKDKKEYAVFHYKHEYNFFEPYAENFAVCIQRLAGNDAQCHCTVGSV
jgi:hypothetical protein